MLYWLHDYICDLRSQTSPKYFKHSRTVTSCTFSPGWCRSGSWRCSWWTPSQVVWRRPDLSKTWMTAEKVEEITYFWWRQKYVIKTCVTFIISHWFVASLLCDQIPQEKARFVSWGSRFSMWWGNFWNTVIYQTVKAVCWSRNRGLGGQSRGSTLWSHGFGPNFGASRIGSHLRHHVETPGAHVVTKGSSSPSAQRTRTVSWLEFLRNLRCSLTMVVLGIVFFRNCRYIIILRKHGKVLSIFCHLLK